MKKYLCLFVCMAISLVFLTGCGNYGNSNSSVGTENTVTKTASSQSAETTDWEPTTYETVNNFDGVTMIVKEGTSSSTSLTVYFENKSSSQCIYGEFFLLEKKINGNWYQVPVIIDGNYGFVDIGYNLTSGDNGEWAVDWEWLYGSLDTGEYRIMKDIQDFRGSGEYDTYYLAAEFTIY
ncbi:immunoglobulin-like domain-containing protein [Desulfoscipio gibsoniae]|uniref:Bacterial Ig-like domain-containing protein n=1 Tax=Desulfoscipio gibsoniae DSM 7213 TaxID=767817 RepID=R4KLF2_9FIRM|nr:immunoglobulin-like domain-containing protein [Desulfoscipio gibsoniae]AGL03494.1 hypothetical protein Desgi_4245 [Desulfoscipio gibsoniae DSM 7213]